MIRQLLGEWAHGHWMTTQERGLHASRLQEGANESIKTTPSCDWCLYSQVVGMAQGFKLGHRVCTICTGWSARSVCAVQEFVHGAAAHILGSFASGSLVPRASSKAGMIHTRSYGPAKLIGTTSADPVPAGVKGASCAPCVSDAWRSQRTALLHTLCGSSTTGLPVTSSLMPAKEHPTAGKEKGLAHTHHALQRHALHALPCHAYAAGAPQ